MDTEQQDKKAPEKKTKSWKHVQRCDSFDEARSVADECTKYRLRKIRKRPGSKFDVVGTNDE